MRPLTERLPALRLVCWLLDPPRFRDGSGTLSSCEGVRGVAFSPTDSGIDGCFKGNLRTA